MDGLKDVVFKGCTRPAMIWGVPLAPFLCAGGAVLIPAIWLLMASPPAGVAMVLLLIPLFVSMRVVSRHDDQRLAQRSLRLRMQLRQRNAGSWGAHAYTPVILKRRH